MESPGAMFFSFPQSRISNLTGCCVLFFTHQITVCVGSVLVVRNMSNILQAVNRKIMLSKNIVLFHICIIDNRTPKSVPIQNLFRILSDKTATTILERTGLRQRFREYISISSIPRPRSKILSDIVLCRFRHQ